MIRSMRTGLLASALLGCLLVGVPARAAERDDARGARAVRLATEAEKLWASRDYGGALRLFGQARELVPAPTLRLREAECLEKLGRLIEAVDLYRDIARSRLAPDAPEVFRRVVEEAQRRGPALDARLPKILIAMSGADAAKVRVQVDGRDVPREIWTDEIAVDPGPHEVVAVAGDDRRAYARVDAVEGATVMAHLAFEPAGPRPASASLAAPVAESGVGVAPAASGAGDQNVAREPPATLGLELAMGASGTLTTSSADFSSYDRWSLLWNAGAFLAPSRRLALGLSYQRNGAGSGTYAETPNGATAHLSRTLQSVLFNVRVYALRSEAVGLWGALLFGPSLHTASKVGFVGGNASYPYRADAGPDVGVAMGLGVGVEYGLLHAVSLLASVDVLNQLGSAGRMNPGQPQVPSIPGLGWASYLDLRAGIQYRFDLAGGGPRASGSR
jgi:hypothetical protein